jgi:hypothetical protein
MENDKKEVYDKMVMSDMGAYLEAKQHQVKFVRLWFEKYMSQYGAFVPIGEDEYIIEFPLPAQGKTLCEPSRIPAEGITVNGLEFTMQELGVAYELLNMKD